METAASRLSFLPQSQGIDARFSSAVRGFYPNSDIRHFILLQGNTVETVIIIRLLIDYPSIDLHRIGFHQRRRGL